VLIRQRDLPIGEVAETSWPDSMIDLQRDLDPDEWTEVLTRELRGLIDGPDTGDDGGELATILQFPDDGSRLRALRATSTPPEQLLQPPRHALRDEDLPRSSVWVARRAERYHRISHH
jgi:hypothetical protein